MPSLIDEHTQFTEDGIPIVGGRIYIGTANTDPVSNLITIYSDRDLTTAIANPQSTNADGRAVNKIWVPGKYSIQVNDSAGNQVYQSLDAGDLPQTGITKLVNVQGTNTITAEGDPLVSTLTDGQQYNFRAVSANTGAVTLQIDLTAAKAIKKLHDQALITGDIEANQTISVIYNATDDVFELVSNPASAAFDSLTVGGNPVVEAKAIATSHIRAGNMQIVDGEKSLTALDIDANFADNVFETVGPTGTTPNAMADMDDIPTTATIVIMDIYCSFTQSGAGSGDVRFYGVSDDVASPTSGPNNWLGVIGTAVSTSEGARSITRLYIPINSNQRFKFAYNSTGATISSLLLYYKGFLTD